MVMQVLPARSRGTAALEEDICDDLSETTPEDAVEMTPTEESIAEFESLADQRRRPPPLPAELVMPVEDKR